MLFWLVLILLLLCVVGLVVYVVKNYFLERRGEKTGYDDVANIDTSFKISTKEMLEKFQTVPQMFDFRCEKHPDRIIFVWTNSHGEETVRVSYGEAMKMVRGIKKDFIDKYKLKGKKVLVLMAPSVEYNLVFLACLQYGVVAVPVYPPKDYAKTIPIVVSIAEDCGAKFIFSTSIIRAQILIAYQVISKEFNPGQFKWLAVPSVDWMRRKYDNLGPEKSMKSSRRRRSAKNDEESQPEDLAYLQYTSGSTSMPKGVMITHHNLMRQMWLQFADFIPGDYFIGLVWIPAYHTTGLTLGVLSPVLSGGTVVSFNPFHFVENPTLWIELLHRYNVQLTIAPNFAFDLCSSRVPQADADKYPLGKDQYCICGAEPILPSTMRKFRDKFKFNNFVNGYGLTEATLVVSMTKDGKLTIQRFDRVLLEKGIVKPVEDDYDDGVDLVANGSIVHKYGMKYAFVDTEMRQVDSSTVGELLVKDETVAKGYYNKPEETQRVFNASFVDTEGEEQTGFLRTGDLGFVLDDLLYICGRIKDIIIIRGRNLYPHDIEKVVTECHSFNAKIGSIAFSVSKYENVEEEQLVIVNEIAREHSKKDLDRVFEAIRKSVSEEFHVQPSYVVLIEDKSLPRTPSHKVARIPCKKLFLANKLKVIKMKRYTE